MSAISKREVVRVGAVNSFVNKVEPVINDKLMAWDKVIQPHVTINDSDIGLFPSNPHYKQIIREIKSRYGRRSRGWVITHSLLASHNSHGWFDFS